MAMTDSLPTGDAGGLTVTDERLILAGLIAKNADGSPRVGVFPSGSAPLVTGRASMGYDVGPFRAATSRTGTGVELLANDASTTVATTAAPGANSRIDVIWVRPQFTANTDPGNVPLLGVTQGTAAAVPTKPPIPAGALELATAEIPTTATTTAAVVITQSGPLTAAAGGVVPVRTATELTAFAAADGTLALNLQTGALMRRAAGAWVVAANEGAWTSVTVFGTGWSGTVQVRLTGSRVDIRGEVTVGSGADFANMFTVPAGFRPTANRWVGYVHNSVAGSSAMLRIASSGLVTSPAGYRDGSAGTGVIVPIDGSWYID